ncbi:MAG: DNA replication/repair protein RecF [Clostridia bacterium]|nr:DNA replication/repair protein RecF [Clostridia bacterium]
MNIKNLTLNNFRNYGSASFDFSGGVNVIWGENGRGKTNILEAVYMLSGSRSWRGAKTEDIVNWSCSSAHISSLVESRGRDFEFSIDLAPKIKAKITINGVLVRKKQQMSEVIRCVLFSPEDLFMIKGGAQNRRDLLDECLCQKYPVYRSALSGYELILRSKQRLLKDGEDHRVLPELNAQLAAYSGIIIPCRYRLTQELESFARDIHGDISNSREELTLRYRTVEGVDPEKGENHISRAVYDSLCAHQSAETAAKSCLAGVHRDDIEVYINGRDARKFASQGQARTAAIALKFSEREILREDEDYPLLLLDDVLSELDAPRQSFILGSTRKGQTIITCCIRPEIFEGANFIDIPDGFLA